jgi:hypothetical protein
MVLEYYVTKGVGKGGCRRYQGTKKKKGKKNVLNTCNSLIS